MADSLAEPVLTLQEVADELGVHYMTAYRYVRLGDLPARKEGGKWWVARNDLAAFRRGHEPSPGHSRTPWDTRLFNRLVAGDESGTWMVVEAALSSGMEVPDVYTEMITPALRRIGEQWSRGELTVADEHAASQIATRTISRLAPRAAKRGVTKGTVVLGTPATELHTLPLMLAAEIVRGTGFEVLDLGSNLPADSFAATAATQQRLVAVGVSATTPNQDDAIAATVATLRRAMDAPILVGGGAVTSEAHARELGADGWAEDGRGLAELLLRLTD